MELFKLFLTAIGFALCIVYLRHINSDLTYLAVIGASIVMLISMYNCVSSTFTVVKEFLGKIKVQNSIIKTLTKAVGIGYLTEWTANIIDDMGVKSLTDKVILCGKFAIIILCLPILTDVINVLTSLIK